MSEDNILTEEIKNQLPQQSEEGFSFSKFIKKKPVWISGIIGLAIIIGITWYFLWGRTTPPVPSSNSVAILIKGPSQLSSGNELEYKIIYRNGEGADLVNLSLEVFYPNNFIYKNASVSSTAPTGSAFNLPMLKKGENAEVVIKGKLSGATGEDKVMKAKLHYKLSNFNSSFNVEESFHTVILPPNLTLDLTGPSDVTNGQDITYSVNYANVSGQEMDSLALFVTYPQNFSFTNSSVPPNKDNNFWLLGKQPDGASGKIDIAGSFSGVAGEEKEVRAEIGIMINGNFSPQIVSSAVFKIIPSELDITIESDKLDNVSMGESIRYAIKYKNRGSIGITNAVVVATIDGAVVNFDNFNTYNGIMTDRTVTWKSATEKSLSLIAPSKEGKIEITVPLKNNFTSNLKNQSVVLNASIYADQITKPVKAVPSSTKVNSKLSLSVVADYISGAAPLEVGKSTVLAVTIMASNLSNDLINTEIVVSVPLPASSWMNKIEPSDQNSSVVFDPNSGMVKWKVGTLPAFTGKFTPVAKITFYLSVTPDDSDRGKPITILKDLKGEGLDSFTNVKISDELSNELITSNLDDDTLDINNGGIVK